MSGIFEGMFKFVLIPCVDGQEMKEFSRPLAGGLEKDELQVTAKEHFASDMDGDARVDSVKQTMLEAGKGLDSLTPEMLARLSSMGAAVEICTLGVPTSAFPSIVMETEAPRASLPISALQISPVHVAIRILLCGAMRSWANATTMRRRNG
jgi:hypothetical protein